MNVDWSKAPEGVIGMFSPKTDSSNHPFFVMTKHEKELMGGLCFCGEKQSGDQYHVFAEFWEWHERPATQQWNSDGLPPVGIECEVLNSDLSNAQWEKCKILFVGVHRVVYDSESCSERVGYADTLQFRPIRTPEQLAAEAREKAIIEIMRDAGITGSAFKDDPEALEWASSLWAKGYRKLEQPE